MCWDLNGNGVGDAGEDTNLDSVYDTQDCQGADGQGIVAIACPASQYLREFLPDGTGVCANAVSSVSAGPGLAGGPITTTGALSLAAPTPSVLGGVRSLSCRPGLVLTGITTAGDAVCTAHGAWSIRTVPRANVFSAVDAGGNVGTYSSLTVGADGLPVIAYHDSTNSDLRVAKCGDLTCSTGTTLTTVDATGVVGSHASIAIGADGLPVIAYFDSTNADLRVAKCGNAACSAGNVLTTVDSANAVGQYTSIGIGTDGLPVIVYYDSTNADLRFAKCGNAACTSGNTLTIIDSAGNVGQYASLAVAPDGRPLVSYYDTTNGDLKLIRCGNAACSSGNVVTTLDAAGNVGTHTSIAIGRDGLAVVSYRDATNADLKLARCVNSLCSLSNLATLDTAGSVGVDTSIAIGPDGFPVVTHYDATNFDLRMVKCAEVGCGTWSSFAIDAADIVGDYSSVAIGADGLPIVSYRDLTNADLKFAHLANEFGVSNLWRRG